MFNDEVTRYNFLPKMDGLTKPQCSKAWPSNQLNKTLLKKKFCNYCRKKKQFLGQAGAMESLALSCIYDKRKCSRQVHLFVHYKPNAAAFPAAKLTLL